MLQRSPLASAHARTNRASASAYESDHRGPAAEPAEAPPPARAHGHTAHTATAKASAARTAAVVVAMVPLGAVVRGRGQVWWREWVGRGRFVASKRATPLLADGPERRVGAHTLFLCCAAAARPRPRHFKDNYDAAFIFLHHNRRGNFISSSRSATAPSLHHTRDRPASSHAHAGPRCLPCPTRRPSRLRAPKHGFWAAQQTLILSASSHEDVVRCPPPRISPGNCPTMASWAVSVPASPGGFAGPATPGTSSVPTTPEKLRCVPRQWSSGGPIIISTRVAFCRACVRAGRLFA